MQPHVNYTKLACTRVGLQHWAASYRRAMFSPINNKQVRKAYDLQDKQVDKHAICVSMLGRV